MLFYAEGKPFYKTIAFLKRHVPRRDDPIAFPRESVGIYFTGVSIPEVERADFANYRDPHIRLREMLPLDSGLHVFAETGTDEAWEMTVLPSAAKAVEQFFLDVFERKAGLGA